MQKTITCYLCGSKHIQVVRTKLRHNIKRDVLSCGTCGLVFLRPRRKDLQSYYASEYRKQHSPVIGKSNDAKEIFDVYAPVQESRLARVKPYLGRRKRVLDVGASAGHFLYKIRPYVKECVAIEFNLENAEFIRKKLHLRAYTELIEKTDIPEEHFDVIFLLQTLEHMDDPLTFLKTAKRYLKPGGILYVEVPNLNEATLSVYHNAAYEDFYYREPHLFYYTPITLRRLVAKAGYTGHIVPFQWYNIVNQMHWLLLDAPQRSGFDGLCSPTLVESKAVPASLRNDLNAWIAKADRDYKRLLEKHAVSDQIVFIGRATGGRR